MSISVGSPRHELPNLMPPEELAHLHGGAEFHVLGRKVLDTLVDLVGLKPHEKVLDVGCGAGRVCIALSQYLDDRGSYDGFDVDRAAIEWCQREIEPRWPRCHFQMAEVRNGYYNPAGQLDASDYRFPYESNQFDLVILTSVFTHLREPDMVHYLHETARVLKPSGRCLVTYFLLNERSIGAVREAKARFSALLPLSEHSQALSKSHAEKAVAYDEPFVHECLASAGLSIREPIYYGGWTRLLSKGQARHSQDYIVAAKS
jgi:ubiquinone/menaquinone biosynthesis C-methylase UbiE